MTKLEVIILNISPTSGPLTVHESAHQKPIQIYPNPVSDVLYMKNLPCEQVEYIIFNVLGQEVASGSTRDNIPVAALPQGLYFVQVTDGESFKTAKFIVR